MYTAVPQNVCLVRDLRAYGVLLDTVADRLQFLQFLSMAADEMAAIETAFLNAQWGLLLFHAHELRANLCYLCANHTVASLAAVITAVRNEPIPPFHAAVRRRGEQGVRRFRGVDGGARVEAGSQLQNPGPLSFVLVKQPCD